jgi:hypothetical protein
MLLPFSHTLYFHPRATPTYLHPPLKGWEYVAVARGVASRAEADTDRAYRTKDARVGSYRVGSKHGPRVPVAGGSVNNTSAAGEWAIDTHG